jgi:hypothetical protein
MNIFLFGNGNISLDDFTKIYIEPIKSIGFGPDIHFTVCDFRGTDTLAIEFLKTETPNVSIFHIGEKSRYLPDKFKTKVDKWTFIGGFTSDKERDIAAIENCTHFLAFDFNSDEIRKSGTLKNIEKCLKLNKIRIQ